MRRTHPHLQIMEYFQVPRGRVLLKKTENRLYGYLDTVLYIPAITRMIIARFQLPRAKTIFQPDLHDTTAPDELDR